MSTCKDKRVGRRGIPVDGFVVKLTPCINFTAALQHGHICDINQKDYDDNRDCSMAELKAKTDEISTYIRNEGFNLVEMWQCEWKSEQSNNVLIREFLKKARLPHHTKKTMTQQEVLRLIRDGSLFGLVECDIHVPPALLEHFEEMPPIFKNTDISKDDIGEHMKTYAENEGLMKKPRRSLIGSMFGKKILLLSS